MDEKIKLNRSHIAKALKDKSEVSHSQLQSLGYDNAPINWVDEVLGKTFTVDQISGFTGTLPVNPKIRYYNKKKKKCKKLKKQVRKPRKPKPKPVNNKYRDNPEWDKKRKAIYARDRHRCVSCGNKGKLNAHHLLYERDKDIWDVPDFYLVTLCDECHKKEHSKQLTPPTKHYAYSF